MSFGCMFGRGECSGCMDCQSQPETPEEYDGLEEESREVKSGSDIITSY